MDQQETDGGERSAVGVYTCEIGQLRPMVQASVSGNEARVAGWGRPAALVVTQCTGVDHRALRVPQATTAPASECTFHRH